MKKKQISKIMFEKKGVPLKNKKRKKLNLFWSKTNFKKQKSNFLNLFFDFKIFDFWTLVKKLEKEKWKVCIVFKSKNKL